MLANDVLVYYKSLQCLHCRKLSEIWNDVIKLVKTAFPEIRTVEVIAKDNSGVFDENVYPKGLIRYNKWFPMVLLVPGPIWDRAIEHLGPKNSVEIVNGVQVLNAVVRDEEITYNFKYDVRQAAEIFRWVKDCYANEDFKKYQAANNDNPIIAPRKDPLPAIKPLLTPLSNTPLPSATLPTAPSYVQGSSAPEDNICGMRIVSRPR